MDTYSFHSCMFPVWVVACVVVDFCMVSLRFVYLNLRVQVYCRLKSRASVRSTGKVSNSPVFWTAGRDI